MSGSPSTNGSNGRDSKGRFTKGNPGGPGNPHASSVAKLRSALLDAVTEKDIREIVGKLISLATGGDVHAAKLLLDRALGSVSQKIEALHEGEIDVRHSDKVRIVQVDDWYGNADRLRELGALPEAGN